jgi:hypothetical protein
MPKAAISVTLERDNLTWLSARTRATRARSLSQTLDDLITAARTGRSTEPVSRSIVGAMTISPVDPDLRDADAAVRAWFDASLHRTAASLARDRQPRRVRRGRRRG